MFTIRERQRRKCKKAEMQKMAKTCQRQIFFVLFAISTKLDKLFLLGSRSLEIRDFWRFHFFLDQPFFYILARLGSGGDESGRAKALYPCKLGSNPRIDLFFIHKCYWPVGCWLSLLELCQVVHTPPSSYLLTIIWSLQAYQLLCTNIPRQEDKTSKRLWKAQLIFFGPTLNSICLLEPGRPLTYSYLFITNRNFRHPMNGPKMTTSKFFSKIR